MKSVLLVHGAGSGPWIWDSWRESFGGAEVGAVDLQAGLDVSEAAMSNYAAAAVAAAELLPRPLVLVGWSMGGLVALMATRRTAPAGLVLLEPSPSAEVQGVDASVSPEAGIYEPADAYGTFPTGVRARPESALARAERKRGLSVPRDAVSGAQVLVVSGEDFADERGAAVASAYGAEHLHLGGLDHWGLVLESSARGAVAGWLAALPVR